MATLKYKGFLSLDYSDKAKAIKAARTIFGISLRDAKDFCDQYPMEEIQVIITDAQLGRLYGLMLAEYTVPFRLTQCEQLPENTARDLSNLGA